MSCADELYSPLNPHDPRNRHNRHRLTPADPAHRSMNHAGAEDLRECTVAGIEHVIAIASPHRIRRRNAVGVAVWLWTRAVDHS
jgi:hypothetical protein